MGILGKNPYPDLEKLGDTADRGPEHIWLEPTNRCNTRCIHCWHYYSDFGEDMPDQTFRKIRDSVLDDVQYVDLIGYGEPLIAKNFDRMFEECVSRNIPVGFTTNGILLRRDERVARLLKGKINIQLSIEGTRAETHEFVRPYVKWDGMIQTLECIKRNTDAAKAAKRFCLRFNFAVMKQNVGDLPDLVLLAAKYGAEEICLLPLAGEDVLEKIHGQSLHDSPEIVSPVFLEALKRAARHKIRIPLPASFREMILDGRERGKGWKGKLLRSWRKVLLAFYVMRARGFGFVFQRIRYGFGPRAKAGKRFCTMPWKDTYFASDGTVFPCCIIGEKLGDVATQEWSEIWNGSLYRNLRRTIHGWNPSATCRYCGLPSGINGGDGRQYAKFFAKYQKEEVPLVSPELELQDGFHEIEKNADGGVSHSWMARRGVLSLVMKKGARFLRLEVAPRAPVSSINPGRCRINDASWEPFDNTCPEITFPLDHVRGERLRVEIEMENAHRVPGDPRELALAVRRIQFLCL